MRGVIVGEVVKVQDSTWTNSKGEVVESYDLFIRQDGADLSFGADRIGVPAELASQVQAGDRVSLVVAFRAKTYKSGPRTGEAYLNAYAVGFYEPAAA